MINLHNHSHYSILDGAQSVEDMVKKVKSLGQNAVALTDHGTLGGWVKLHNICEKEKVKPIYGLEAYIVDNELKIRKSFHITLLAKNQTGYRNIIKLNNLGHLRQFYYQPRLTPRDLFTHKEGIIILSGCPNGLISRNIERYNAERAFKIAERFKEEFGDDFYIEVQDHGLDIEEKITPGLIKIANKLNIKIVPTNDSHYTEQGTEYIWRLIKANSIQSPINNIEVLPDEFYMKSSLGSDLEPYEKTTLEIAEKCNAKLEYHKNTIPHIGDIKNYIDKKRIVNRKKAIFEYKSFKEANLLDYLCVVSDYIRFAKEHKIPVGPGRGSCMGSILTYAMHITEINPEEYGLFFSRFWNPGRKDSMPDIDIDFSPTRINEVKEYLRNKYGESNVVRIGDFSILKPKGAFKSVCRALGVPFAEANKISQSLPKDIKSISEFKTDDEKTQLYIQHATKIEGLIDKSGVHPAGTIISAKNLYNCIPLKKDRKTEDVVCQWDMHDVEQIGFVKFDILAIDVLDIIQNTINLI